jgi:hypothetical protein
MAGWASPYRRGFLGQTKFASLKAQQANEIHEIYQVDPKIVEGLNWLVNFLCQISQQTESQEMPKSY